MQYEICKEVYEYFSYFLMVVNDEIYPDAACFFTL